MDAWLEHNVILDGVAHPAIELKDPIPAGSRRTLAAVLQHSFGGNALLEGRLKRARPFLTFECGHLLRTDVTELWVPFAICNGVALLALPAHAQRARRRALALQISVVVVELAAATLDVAAGTHPLGTAESISSVELAAAWFSAGELGRDNMIHLHASIFRRGAHLPRQQFVALEFMASDGLRL